MTEIRQIKERLENIFRELTKHYYNKESIKKELETITHRNSASCHLVTPI